MKIITIRREFGSGGRELGKRLVDALGMPCYDHEIIDLVAQQHGLDKDYIAHISEKDIRTFYPSTVAHRFSLAPHTAGQPIKVALAEHVIIRQLANAGDCVIVGRCTDVVCRDMHPLNIFVYADTLSKLRRCEERAGKDEHFSEKELLCRMKQIDKERAGYCELFSENEWGKKESYHLCVNTSGQAIKALIPALAQYARDWFSQQ